MSSDFKTIAVVGCTGKLATLIIHALLTRHPTITIHGICRSPSKLDPKILVSPNTKIFEAESTDSAALRAGLKGIDICVCCYYGPSTLMIDGQKFLIDACIAEGAPRYMASNWSFDYRFIQFGDNPAKDPMKHVAAYLEEVEERGQIKEVHILNGGFYEMVFTHMLGYAVDGMFQYYGTGQEVVEATSMRDAAAYTAEVAVDGSATGFFRFFGDSFPLARIPAIYNSVYGENIKTKVLGSLDDLDTNRMEMFKKDPQNVHSWLGLFYQYNLASGVALMLENDNAMYPSVKPDTLEDFMMRHTKESVVTSHND